MEPGLGPAPCRACALATATLAVAGCPAVRQAERYGRLTKEWPGVSPGQGYFRGQVRLFVIDHRACQGP